LTAIAVNRVVKIRVTNPSTRPRFRLRKLPRIAKGIPMKYIDWISPRASAISRRFGTRFALCRPIIGTCVTLGMLVASISASAVDISVMVVDRDGHGVGEAVVTATPATANVGSSPTLKSAVMDQRNLAFVPRVLVVGVGTRVEFPNNDSVSHQVYSFSAAKRFQLPLYKGEVHPPITFDRPGLVVLGCNIHDGMVGYIYVTDAPYFAKTDVTGGAQLTALPGGDYRITIWSPFIADPPASLVRAIHVDGNAPAPLRVQLSQALHAQPEPKPHRRDWEY
jgi:plastocyanin